MMTIKSKLNLKTTFCLFNQNDSLTEREILLNKITFLDNLVFKILNVQIER